MKEEQSSDLDKSEKLSLRVSAATLARVIFPSLHDGQEMLALEHKATAFFSNGEWRVVVKAQPFGGALRILNPAGLEGILGDFRYDDERSRLEQDFRIVIRPSSWPLLRDYCLHQIRLASSDVLEIDPTRELEEEFEDTLGQAIKPGQYRLQQAGIVVENEPAPTRNIYAASLPTVRLYRVFEVSVIDPVLIRAMLISSENHPRRILEKMALDDANSGGRGRANAMMVRSLRIVQNAFLAIPPDYRHHMLPFEDTYLEGNVVAVLQDVTATTYTYL